MLRSQILKDQSKTEKLGEEIALELQGKTPLIYLTGDLGAGKTTLTRGLIRALTRKDTRVLSPSYSYLNHYQASSAIYHFDLYRLDDPEQIHQLGLLSFLEQTDALRIVEWPERAQGLISTPDIHIHLEIASNFRWAHLNYLPG